MVRSINPSGDSNPSNLISVNGKLAFTAEDGTTGTSLWVSDGTAAGTQLPRRPVARSRHAHGRADDRAGGLAYFRS